MNAETDGQPRKRDFFPWFIAIGICSVVGVVMFLFVTIVQGDQQNANQRAQAEKTRGDLLQKSVDSLRQHLVASEQAAAADRAFFELVRKLLVTQDAEQRKVLLDQLKTFKFSTAQQPQSTSAPATTPSPSTTRAPPASTTTTTSTTQPRSVQPRTCIIVPVLNRQVCH